MPPQSRGTPRKPPITPTGFQSKSTPNLPTLRSLERERHAGHISSANATPAALHPHHAIAIFPDISSENLSNPSEPVSIDGFSLDAVHQSASSIQGSSGEESGAEGEGKEEEEEDGHVPNLLPRPIYHHHSRSHTHLGPSAFAPPFYNRPPTPLPPSPSLTSLLRPNFSSQNSRPTTPDPSSDEGTVQTRLDATGTQTPNSAAASTLTNTFRSAKPIPRASPKVPTYEYYGFTLYLTSSLAFIVYLLWAFLPSPFLHQLGIYYYPNRWWALAIPAWTVMFVIYIYVALASYNVGYLTLPLHSVGSLVDEAANVAVVDEQGQIIRNELASWHSPLLDADKHKHKGSAGKKSGTRGKNGAHSRQSSVTKVQPSPELDWQSLWNEGTDAVMDIPIGGVCEILYGVHADEDDNDPFGFEQVK